MKPPPLSQRNTPENKIRCIERALKADSSVFAAWHLTSYRRNKKNGTGSGPSIFFPVNLVARDVYTYLKEYIESALTQDYDKIILPETTGKKGTTIIRRLVPVLVELTINEAMLGKFNTVPCESIRSRFAKVKAKLCEMAENPQDPNTPIDLRKYRTWSGLSQAPWPPQKEESALPDIPSTKGIKAITSLLAENPRALAAWQQITTKLTRRKPFSFKTCKSPRQVLNFIHAYLAKALSDSGVNKVTSADTISPGSLNDVLVNLVIKEAKAGTFADPTYPVATMINQTIEAILQNLSGPASATKSNLVKCLSLQGAIDLCYAPIKAEKDTPVRQDNPAALNIRSLPPIAAESNLAGLHIPGRGRATPYYIDEPQQRPIFLSGASCIKAQK